MMLYNTRQRLQVALILFFIVVAFAADSAWIPWATVVIFLTMILITDLLFLDDNQFKYDPNYKNWSRQTDPKY
ncbi:hypothetical protein H310_10645 [Aphanomyces invadans]|uniref:Uncharacterized protein n=1 Tax=Aphanomyces invadans TaxID=157072 RepID=A0A024TPC5_9STRA|nr:hypothetical protein H310_10645 [Aphanomyces invadans]ETV95990.1 hypothetical protein H310_10645 [Aphanomyces invadans]|eukprot:XP_008875301.1 hypothetical protein H310_10645 [Aphanomyces invadans]